MAAGIDRQRLGRSGEDAACALLVRLGYAVIARRYRSRYGEIDIICRHDGLIVFVEVKARRTRRRGAAVESMTGRKRRRIAAMALDYLAWTGQTQARCRFDVVAIDGFGTDDERAEVFADAFHVDR